MNRLGICKDGVQYNTPQNMFPVHCTGNYPSSTSHSARGVLCSGIWASQGPVLSVCFCILVVLHKCQFSRPFGRGHIPLYMQLPVLSRASRCTVAPSIGHVDFETRFELSELSLFGTLAGGGTPAVKKAAEAVERAHRAEASLQAAQRTVVELERKLRIVEAEKAHMIPEEDLSAGEGSVQDRLKVRFVDGLYLLRSSGLRLAERDVGNGGRRWTVACCWMWCKQVVGASASKSSVTVSGAMIYWEQCTNAGCDNTCLHAN